MSVQAYIHTAATLVGDHMRALRKNRFVANMEAQSATIMAIVTGAITILLGVIIFANIKSAMPAVNDTAANATMDSVGTIFYSSVNLVTIGFLVLAAVFILAVISRLRQTGE